MKKATWWIAGSVLILVLLILIGKFGRDKGIKVVVEPASLRTIVETVTASGKIYPETEVKISPEVSGEIIELTVEEGDSVQRGQLLVKINPAIYSSMVSQAEASVLQSRSGALNAREMEAQAEAQYNLARSTFERNRQLYEDKVISRLEFEQAEANYKGALAAHEASRASSAGGGFGVEAAQANLVQARENLRRTTILAPVSGIISQLNVKKGERMVGTAQMAGTEMLTIADMSRLEVRVNVSETDIAKVKLGDTTIIDADAYRDRKFKGIVSKVAVSSGLTGGSTQVSTDQVTNYVVHILILPESYAGLAASAGKGRFIFKPGMSASVDIQTRTAANTLSVPVNAVTTRDWPDSLREEKRITGGGSDIRQVVFVYDEAAQKVRMRDVTTGLQDNLYIQVTGGLKEGERIVTAPYGAVARLLKEGTEVKVVKKEQLFEAKTDK